MAKIQMSNLLSEIYKPNSGVSEALMNEVASIVLGYCMTTAFLVKPYSHTILPSHFIRLVSYLESGKTSVTFTNMQVASGPYPTYDYITLNAPTSQEASNFIIRKLKDTASPEFCMVRSILDFVNGDHSFTGIVNSIVNNGIPNSVVIDVENVSLESPGMTTILVDNQYVNTFDKIIPIYNYSCGTGGIGQKELQKDYGYDAHRQFILGATGIDIGPDSAVYYQTAHNNGSPSAATMDYATREVYKNVCRKANEGLAGAYDSAIYDFRQDLITTMLNCSLGIHVGQDITCLLVPGGKIDYKVFKSDKLMSAIYNGDLSFKCPDNMNPSVRVMDGKTELFQIRFKKEKYGGNLTGHRYKMYFKNTKLDEYY